MAWYSDAWCVLTTIKFSEPFEPCVVLSIHCTEADARALIDSLTEDDHWPTTTRLIKCNRNISGLKEGDILCGHKIDMILNYYERDRDSDDVWKVI